MESMHDISKNSYKILVKQANYKTKTATAKGVRTPWTVFKGTEHLYFQKLDIIRFFHMDGRTSNFFKFLNSSFHALLINTPTRGTLTP
jgi:hypothetical protein